MGIVYNYVISCIILLCLFHLMNFNLICYSIKFCIIMNYEVPFCNKLKNTIIIGALACSYKSNILPHACG